MKEQKITNNEFLNSIDSLIETKYILAERKINDVLQSLAGCKDVYNLVAKSMINFDYESEMKKIEESQIFKLPENDGNRIAFIFCLLSSIDDKKINFTNFISNYFDAQNSFTAYNLFIKTVIEEFKRLIIKSLKIEICENELGGEQENAKEDNFAKLENVVISTNYDITVNKKIRHINIANRDLTAILSTFLIIIKKREIEYFYAFRVIINSAFGGNKIFRKNLEEMNKLIDQIIRGIYE